MRILVIGDIHGGLKALIQVLERSKFDSEKDQLIFLGDYVDGWSESAELIQYLINLEIACVIKPIFIRGNHDKWCEDWLTLGARPLIWTQQGGEATLQSYIKTGYLASEEHRTFFAKLHNYYIDDKNRGFVHGGFKSRKGLGHEVYQADYYWDRDLWQLALLQHNRIHETELDYVRRFEKHSELYIGHTSTINWEVKPHYPEYQYQQNGDILVPMNRCNVWNLDTGGGFGGKLTIMDIDTKEFWQSDLLKDLYPYEHGR